MMTLKKTILSVERMMIITPVYVCEVAVLSECYVEDKLGRKKGNFF